MKTMSGRILRSIMFAAIAVAVASLVFIIGFTYENISAMHIDELKKEAILASAGVEDSGTAYLERASDGNRLTWIDSDGTVLWDTQKDASEMENHADREEFREAEELGAGQSSRYSATLSQKTVNYAVRLEDGSVLRVSSTRFSVFSLVLSMLQPICIVLLITIVFSAILASRLAKSAVKPINELNFNHPEDASTYEELAPLLTRLSDQNRKIKAQISELERRQLEFTAITENMSEGLLVIDERTELLSYNSSAMRLLGADPAREYKGSVLELNRSESFRSTVDTAISGTHCEADMSNGGRRYQIIGNPVSDGNNTAGAVILILDVTEREEREELRREFTANVSHELKTPLTSISGFAEIIRNGLVKADDIPKFASNIYDETQRLITLVGDIIKLSRLDENAVGIDEENIDLYTMMQSIAERLEPAAAPRGIKISVAGGHAWVTAVSQVADEMLFNIADNAVKYNKDGGSVKITADTDAQGKPFVRVSDTGIGIPTADRERIFERFYRVNKSHSKEIGGTGLGLSIVKHAAAFLGAEINLDSTPGKGTTVTVTFDANDNNL